VLAGSVRLADVLREDCVIADLSGRTVGAVLAELARPVAAARRVDVQRLVDALAAREKLGSTGVGEGVAVPHGKVPGLAGLAAAFGRCRAGVDFRAIDGKPAFLFLALFAPQDAGAEHLQALARASRLLKRQAFRQALLDAPDAAAMHRLIVDEDARL
jgi:PTS system nitrogen regulatory IIA component